MVVVRGEIGEVQDEEVDDECEKDNCGLSPALGSILRAQPIF